ncbi:hypothetical protein CKO44_18710 [Rubrivivax gelatinosus]|uniref:hypothetical protein n=1 Tax=Rubrivivax gelatinosus TaxID=28068 RepID=UPI0019069A1F|nr:hypothetical protein [Rubrivivax gelatinosus]MBK1615496.1 hypothetical protein [Rubrivivax gelatinosus]
MMMTRHAAALALSAAWLHAGAVELTGTPYTVLYRGLVAAPAAAAPGRQIPAWPYNRAQPPAPAAATGAPLRLVDVQTRRDIARASYDARLGGYLFQLPLVGVDAAAPPCLAIVDMRQQALSVRAAEPGDAGFAFRNPAWEQEIGRAGEQISLRGERERVEAQIRDADNELGQHEKDFGAAVMAGQAACPVPPARPGPPRPAAALEPAELPAVAGALCALHWEREVAARVDLGPLFTDAGAAADWRGRGEARPLAESMPGLRLAIVAADAALVREAAAKGRTFLEHADGLRVFGRVQAACRNEVGRQAQEARSRWLAEVDAAARHPQREQQRCEDARARVTQLRAARIQGPQYLAALDRRLAALANPPAADDPIPLDRETCR